MFEKCCMNKHSQEGQGGGLYMKNQPQGSVDTYSIHHPDQELHHIRRANFLQMQRPCFSSLFLKLESAFPKLQFETAKVITRLGCGAS